MKGVLIKIKEGHTLDGEGEGLGNDLEGQPYTFWKSQGNMEVPLDLAILLERENPQRYELVDKTILSRLGIKIKKQKAKEIPKDETPIVQPITPKVQEPKITLKELNDMPNKDAINDFAAKRDYDVNPSRQSRTEMIAELVKQIEKRTGKKVR